MKAITRAKPVNITDCTGGWLKWQDLAQAFDCKSVSEAGSLPDLLWETSLRVKVPTVNQANFEFAIQASPAHFGRTNLQAEQDERDAGGQLLAREEAPRGVKLRVEHHRGDGEHEEDEVHDEVCPCSGRQPPFWTLKGPARPYESVIRNRFAVENAKAA